MSEETLETKEEPKEIPIAETPAPQASKEDLEKLIQQRVSESLKDIKGKLDNAYSARDEAFKKVAEYEQKEREAELARLKEEGKHKEAYELQLAQERARFEALEKKNIELTRDIDVKNVLNAFTFKNESAANIAYKMIVADLVQNESGEWMHKTGSSINEYVKQFAEANNFLFEHKISTGPGVTATKPSTPSSSNKSIFAMTQEEVLKLAAEGKLSKNR
jgi:hypothetical protein